MNTHDCISKVRESLMKQSKDIKYIRFKFTSIRSIPHIENEDVKTGQPIEIGYDYKKKDGTIIMKEEKTFVSHEYCPFCGKKYN